MRGIVFNAPRDVSVEDVPDPAIIEPGDALVRVTKAGICGTGVIFCMRMISRTLSTPMP